MRKLTRLFQVNLLRAGGYPRVLLITLDAAITAPLRPKRRLVDQVQSILGRKSRKFDKVPSAINLVDNIIPGVSRGLSNYLCTSNQAPFNSTYVKLIDYGTGATVFLLERGDEHKVLKVYRKSLGKPLNGLLEVANEFRRKYELVSSWYNGDFDLVARGEFLILNSPLLGSPGAAISQQYIYGEKKDFFKDFSDEELLSLMSENENLRKQFIFFAERTISVYSKRELFLDLIGRNNVMLVNNEDNWSIVIIDNGVFDLVDTEVRMPDRHFQIEEYISRIKFLLTRVTANE
jgi:hypothetical protein